MQRTPAPGPAPRMPGKGEFVALTAALMASNALAIDTMLPALPAIGESLLVDEANRRQLVIAVYLFGFGIAQLIYGPLSDRLGRKALLAWGLVAYAGFALLAATTLSFTALLAARFLQGVAAAATRVLVTAVVRDRYEGPVMAQIMSLSMIVFMTVPILAPSLGQAMLLLGSWREIFFVLAAYGALLAIWVWWRLPETLAEERRRPLSFRSIGEGVAVTLRTRQSIGNALVQTLIVGALFGFINSIQQIVSDAFGRPALLGLVFACAAVPMAASAYANSRLVMRYGSRRLLLGALAAFSAAAALHLTVALTWGETIWSFAALQAVTVAAFGMIGANAGALAMEPLGHVAGTASSVQGAMSAVGGALIGFMIGQGFDGTTIPFLAGFAVCGVLALVAALWANRRPYRDSHSEAEVDEQELASRPA